MRVLSAQNRSSLGRTHRAMVWLEAYKRGAKLISCVKAGSRAVLAVTGRKPAPMDEIAKFFDFEEAGVLD